LEETFKAQGLHVLGFVSDDFDQAGSEGQIDACNDKYGVTFQTFAVAHVKDPDGAGPGVPQPVYEWLAAQPKPGPSNAAAPTWNFHKYLVSRDGKLVGHWDEWVYPGDDPNNPGDGFDTNPIVVAIKAELAK
jgi:glutathione peroxidase